MTEGNKKKTTIAGLVFVIAGIAGFAYPFVYGFFNNEEIAPDKNISITQAQLPTFEDLIVASEESILTTPLITPLTTLLTTPKTSTPTAVKDHLVIAGVNINMPIFVGETEKILDKGGWLFSRTSRPDRGSNTVIFGHRYMYKPPKSNTFWNLDKVKIGDEMILFWQGKEYRYKVSEIKIVEPTDLSVMQPSSGSILTVITCTPLFTTKQRLVVVGSLQ